VPETGVRRGTRGVHDDVSVRRGDVARVAPPSQRTPLLHATTIHRREGEEGGGHERDHDNDNDDDDGGGGGVSAAVLLWLVVVVRDRVASTRI
jgi:hypothetical protein